MKPTTHVAPSDRTDFDNLFDGHPASLMTAPSQAIHAAAAQFWDSAMSAPQLSSRMKELVLLALHACSSAINETAIVRHMERAIDAGATETDVLDVLLSIVGQANHALYFALPILIEEGKRANPGNFDAPPELREDLCSLKAEFIRTRGFWNEDRDLLARYMPSYFKALSTLSIAPWKDGSLTPCERELIYIAIDSSVTHMFEAGLRLHIRNAIKAGATQALIIEVLQLVSLIGLEGYVIAASELIKRDQTQ